MNNFIEETMKLMKAGFDLTTWTQDQAQKYVSIVIEQSKTNTDEAGKFVTELWEQGKKNQEQMQKMVNETVTTVFSNFNVVQ